MNDFIQWNGWFDQQYRPRSELKGSISSLFGGTRLGGRWPTFRVALNLLYQMPRHIILETGTVRMKDDWIGGQSTLLFGEFVSKYGGKVVTVDNNSKNMEICKQVTQRYAEHIEHVVSDSIVFLQKYVDDNQCEVAAIESINEQDEAASVRSHKPCEFDLIYLDSMDCPNKGDATYAQEHQLRELKLALQMINDKSIILLDDTGFANGGKTKLSNEYLFDVGWTCLMMHQQSLWIRRP